MNNVNHIVRAKSFWKGRAALCAIAFLVTGLAVHQVAKDRFRQANLNPSATAIIYHGFASETGSQCPRPTTDEIRRQVLSDGGLQRAMTERSGRTGNYLLDALGQIQRTLQVEVSEDTAAERFKISITAQDPDIAQAVRLVNALAKQYVNDHGSDFRVFAEAEHLHSQDLKQQAKREWTSKSYELDEFLIDCFGEETTQTTGVKAVPSARLAGQFVGLARSSDRMIENPAWTDLNQQLSLQRGIRSQLEPDTHQTLPQLRILNERIADLEQRLALTPRTIPELSIVHPLPRINPASGNIVSNYPPPPREMGNATGDNQLPPAAMLQQFLSCQEAVRIAADEHDRRVLLERQAWEQKSLLSVAEVHAAQMPGAVAHAADDRTSPRAILLALASALAMAAGIAMISSGMASDPALCNAAEVESMLPAPLIGGISSRTPVALRPSTRGVGAMTLLVYGMVLVVVCFGVLLALFGPGL